MNEDFLEAKFFSMYDHGWRAGTFDKCNGKEFRKFENLVDSFDNMLYLDGYKEAYDANEVRI